jgi:hypothetical protein
MAFGEGLLIAATRWTDAAWLLQNQVLVAGALLALAAPAVVRWLEQ